MRVHASRVESDMILILIVSFILGGGTVGCVSNDHAASNSGRSTLLETEWVEQHIGSSNIVLSAPWQLESRTPARVPEVANVLAEDVSLWREADGITIVVTYMRLLPGRSLNFEHLELGADAMLATFRSSPGVISVEASKSEESFLGMRAISLDAVVKNQDGSKDQVHLIAFGEGSESCQLMLAHPSEQEDGDIVWAKLRNGIRRVAA